MAYRGTSHVGEVGGWALSGSTRAVRFCRAGQSRPGPLPPVVCFWKHPMTWGLVDTDQSVGAETGGGVARRNDKPRLVSMSRVAVSPSPSRRAP
jgi:hypothetical protein